MNAKAKRRPFVSPTLGRRGREGIQIIWRFLVRSLLIVIVECSVSYGGGIPTVDIEFLRDLTADVIKDSSVAPGSNGGGRWPLTNNCGFALITPGKDTYTAFWIRDFSMAADSGLISDPELLRHLMLICRSQNGNTEVQLAHGLHLPPWAIPDHINYNGRPSFFPGTYSSGNDQGDGTFGRRPPVDDHYEFIHIGYEYWCRTHTREFLFTPVNGVVVFQRFVNAFGSPEVEQGTGLVVTSEADRAVGFGFCDAEVHTGRLLFASLLRYRAAGELAELARVLGKKELATQFKGVQKSLRASIAAHFADSNLKGWLRASTGLSAQPDVWGTLFALHLRVLDPATASAARRTIAEATRRGTITLEGAVRQVPVDLDFSSKTAWQKSLSPLGVYQNGGYWHTASGWLIEILWSSDRKEAKRLFGEMMQHLRTQDYRKGPGFGAPWEVFGPNGSARQNPVYMASVALPYSILRNFARHRP